MYACICVYLYIHMTIVWWPKDHCHDVGVLHWHPERHEKIPMQLIYIRHDECLLVSKPTMYMDSLKPVGASEALFLE